MQSYIGISLFSSEGASLGLIAALGRNPIQKDKQEKITALLQIFAARAGAELERKRGEERLKKSEENYRSIFNAANDAMFIHDIQTGAIVAVNQKMSEMYGYSAEEAKQVNMGRLSAGTPGYTQEDAMQLIKRAMEGLRPAFDA